MDGNIVENMIKYCQTSKISVVFIHKTCNKDKSILHTFCTNRSPQSGQWTVGNAWL